MYIDTFETVIEGVPCMIGVKEYEPGSDHYTYGHPDQAELGWAEEFRFDVLKLNGRPFPWLSAQVCDVVADDVLKEFLDRHAD